MEKDEAKKILEYTVDQLLMAYPGNPSLVLAKEFLDREFCLDKELYAIGWVETFLKSRLNYIESIHRILSK